MKTIKDYLQYNSSINPVHLFNALFISIVLYLHHGSYTESYLVVPIEIHYLLQKFAIGGFFFFSGLKLAISNRDIPASVFINKRITRIYFLYIIALIVASFTSYPYLKQASPNTLNFLLHALCLQAVLPNLFGANFHTLWFVSILSFCYALFLLMRGDLSNSRKFLIKLAAIYTTITIISFTSSKLNFQILSSSVALYTMFFLTGMVSINYKAHMSKYAYLIAGLVGNLVLLVYYYYTGPHPNTWYSHIAYSLLVVLGNAALFVFLIDALKKLNLSNQLQLFIKQYSCASFCVFLFHRSIWTIMVLLYPQQTILQWFYIVVLGIPVIVLASYLIQYCFNALVSSRALS